MNNLSKSCLLDKEIRHIGRTYFDTNTGICWLGLSGSGVEFYLTGGPCYIELIADKMYVSELHRARFALYVDDKLVIDDVVDQPTRVLTFDISNRPSVVRLIKISECAQSTMGISKINIESGQSASPTPRKEKLIEFIGDSITCGYGVDVETPDSKFSTSTEDFRKSYAYLTSRILNCEYSMVCYSGYGIISGYTETDAPHPDILPPIYDCVGSSMGSQSDFYLRDIEWHFEHKPDLIVINLGTNDATFVKDVSERKCAFISGYVNFLRQVRSKNPDSPILCTIGIMGDSLYECIQIAVKEYSERYCDDGVFSFKFDVQQPEDGYAIGWHPTYKTYVKASRKLSDYILNKFNW